MGISELTQSLGWKKFMAKLYGWGASVVIVGALFKILHLPGANQMLIVGLGTEAIIFFFSAFEPVHEELDWTLVYPELAGLGEEDEIDAPKEKGKKKEATGIQKFEEMLENAGLKADVFQKLGDGINSLNKTASQLSDISDAALATNQFTSNIKAAASSVNELSDSYKKTAKTVTDSATGLADAYKQSAEALSYSVDSLSDSYSKTAQQVSKSSEKFIESYESLSKSMNLDFSTLAKGNKEYSDGITTLNKNLTALNAIFELQLQEADLDKMMEDLQGSVEQSRKYYGEVTKLNERLSALNTVYGNMLTAMNVHFNK